MATATTLQYLEQTDSSGTAYSVGTSNRRQIETFIADGSIGLGDVVTFDVVATGGSEVVLKVIEAAADKSAIGVALNDAEAGERVNVCLSGICEAQVEGANNAGNSAIAAGDYLCLGDTAGTLYKFTAGADAVPHAIAVDTAGSGDAAAQKTVIFLKQF